MADETHADLRYSEGQFDDRGYHSTPKQSVLKGSSHYRDRDSGFMSMQQAGTSRAEKSDLAEMYSSVMDSQEDPSSPDVIEREIEKMQEQLHQLDVQNQSLRETANKGGLKAGVRSKTESSPASPRVRFSESTYSSPLYGGNTEDRLFDNITSRDTNRRRATRYSEQDVRWHVKLWIWAGN